MRQKPKADFEILYASTSQVDPAVHDALIDAIQQKCGVQIDLKDGSTHFGEPHVYGERGGYPTVLLYDGNSEPNWTLLGASDIASAKILQNKPFKKRQLPPEFEPGPGH